MTTAILILAGGKASRLGGLDKALLDLAGQPLIAHVLARLAAPAERLAISANGDAARFAAYHLPVLADAPELAGKGPLAGVAAGLTWAAGIGAATLLTIPVDTPFVPEDLAGALAPAPAVACHRGRQHHLVALWPVGFRSCLLEFLAAPNAYRVRDALALCGARQVEFRSPTDPFANINTPEDLVAARRRQQTD